MYQVDLAELIEDLKRHEGFRSRVYTDTLGVPTIGIGFAIKDLELDEEICNQILEKKISKLLPQIFSSFPHLKNQPNIAKIVVINMCYQMGVRGVSKFKKFHKALENNDYITASAEMLDSRWSRQTPNRAKELSEKIKSLAS
jgi:lysozyme